VNPISSIVSIQQPTITPVVNAEIFVGSTLPTGISFAVTKQDFSGVKENSQPFLPLYSAGVGQLPSPFAAAAIDQALRELNNTQHMLDYPGFVVAQRNIGPSVVATLYPAEERDVPQLQSRLVNRILSEFQGKNSAQAGELLYPHVLQDHRLGQDENQDQRTESLLEISNELESWHGSFSKHQKPKSLLNKTLLASGIESHEET
jgi:hypothetical protein